MKEGMYMKDKIEKILLIIGSIICISGIAGTIWIIIQMYKMFLEVGG